MSNPNFKKMTRAELIQLRDGTQGWHPNSAGCIAELARRDLNVQFWRRDIVAWLALIIAVISLFISLSKP